ncbi:glycoside hydrolase family 127 protein [Microbacterium horticulturae]|uniref:Glycoside hydrolase family 127 protein n=1 Tax=Microbacterium horticulturae TaxID=3028316 RepID=A0ABY8C1C3_9MICO|nr:beta-L-arabinofuranosidase domain-containing protein [Microbacterium sp. KACC 23027]WEG09542.1 glycoside hydrolase family 127 protein [Microbacterium sp. KACC 23027]
MPVTPVVPSVSTLRPLGLDEVHITGGFWAHRQEVNARGTLAHIGARLESEGWLPNFDLAAQSRVSEGRLPEGRRGREFADSEVYKYLEALAWETGRTGDADLEQRLRATVARVAAAQEPDGYLNTAFGRPGQPPRWSDLAWGHELYCLGHLFQAAVARHRTAPGADDGLVEIARRAADLICATFGRDGNPGVCGHPEIEVALVELGRALDVPAYIDQAALFVERRGHGVLGDIEWGRSYFQDDVSVREATVLRGHAVRANYLAAGAADVAAERDDLQLLDALRTQWETTIARRTYLTGGQGSHHQDEAFGEDWELPADRAYSETCAGVGSIMFSWRMLLATADPRYADLVERTLYNVVATSPSDDGCAFFYANPLHQRVPGAVPDPDATSPRASSSLRAPWFEVSCCPPNVARTLASLDAYVATATDDGIQLHQYASCAIRTTLPSGAEIALDVQTGYPAEGRVRIEIGADAEFELSLRVPAWAEGASVQVAGVVDAAAPGVHRVRRAFRRGDVVELTLPVAPRVTRPDPRIDAARGCIAVERGPEVFALESVDLDGFDDVADAVAGAEPIAHDGQVWLPIARRDERDDTWPYAGAESAASLTPVEMPLVPYHSWGNRGPSTMRVWIPTA